MEEMEYFHILESSEPGEQLLLASSPGPGSGVG